jgi:hypothetical protein
MTLAVLSPVGSATSSVVAAFASEKEKFKVSFFLNV